MSERILLIGNGPKATEQDRGVEIDAFKGSVARFNNYTTKGYELQVGSRCDIWITLSNFSSPGKRSHKAVYLCREDKKEKLLQIQKTLGEGALLIPSSARKETALLMGHNHPSTGAIAVRYFSQQGWDVWVYGFDYLDPSRLHHYNKDGADRGPWHSFEKERALFERWHKEGKVQAFSEENS